MFFEQRAPEELSAPGVPAWFKSFTFVTALTEIAVGLAVIIITASKLSVYQYTGTWDSMFGDQQQAVECLLGKDRGFNVCSYTYALGALGMLFAALVWNIQTDFFHPFSSPLSAWKTRALVSTAAAGWWAAGGVVIAKQNDPRFGGQCMGCSQPMASYRTAVWALSFTAAGIFLVNMLVMLGCSAAVILFGWQPKDGGRRWWFLGRRVAHAASISSSSSSGDEESPPLPQPDWELKAGQPSGAATESCGSERLSSQEEAGRSAQAPDAAPLVTAAVELQQFPAST